MKSELKQLFRDVNTAVQLKRPEAVDIALNGLLRLPGVSGNDHMSDGFITKVVLPVGEKLSALSSSLLRPLLRHPLVAGRAIGATALAHRFLKVNNTTLDDLQQGGSDPRSDVRLSLGRTLIELKTTNASKVFNLGKSWIGSTSPRLRQTALIFLPTLVDLYPSEIADLLYSMVNEKNDEVNSAIVDALTVLGNNGVTLPVLDLLSGWSKVPDPNDWVICRVLSASWVTGYPVEVSTILRQIASKQGESKTITAAIKALKRNGVDIDLPRDLMN